MRKLTFALTAIAALVPAGAIAMPMGDAPSIEEARTIYAQCLSVGAARAARTEIADHDAFAAARSSCAEQRHSLTLAADGNLDMVAALDSVHDQFESAFAGSTRAIRVKRVTVRQH